jgi:hypothetical protein
MSGPDAMHGEMPGFFPGRPGGEHDEPLLDMILERRLIPPGAPPEIHDLAHMLAAAAGPAEPGELTGEAAALAAFTRLGSPAGVSPAGPRSARRQVPARRARGRLPLAAALTAVAAGLGSTAAAYAGVLPSPIQHFAHEIMGAPAPHHDVSAVAGAPAHPPRQPSASAPPGSHEAASSVPPGGHDSPGNRIHGFPGNPAGNNLATCPPSAGGTRNQSNHKIQNQKQGQSQKSRPSPTPATVTQSPGPGQDPGQSQSKASPSLKPGPQASINSGRPPATACPTAS